ncbi:MAG: hypothetical protein JO013_10985 [Alphaproteobacteria bacterium]|nr:hypothetical protein [Alphaproteobacteria bacterium]
MSGTGIVHFGPRGCDDPVAALLALRQVFPARRGEDRRFGDVVAGPRRGRGLDPGAAVAEEPRHA